ncbi:glycosyl transferase family 21-domain-containing protein [Sporodiniella umbellata]|nr:glycosyl transferase family 21-domain-containing protein [Sporodiniella umbellata]
MSLIVTAISYILSIWYTFMILLSLLGQYVGQSRYRQKPLPVSSKASGHETQGVSILRPLKGVDLELERNLRSAFSQNYPKFEIIFSVASANDPAIPIVNRLIQEYPSVKSRLIVGDQHVGINPKVNNLIKPYQTAEYDILWVLDSNVYVDKDTLGRSVDLLSAPGIGLVHHLPVAVEPASYSAEVEHLFLNTNHAKMYLAINAVGVASCVMGKSNLYRRSDLERVGGLARFGRYMAEDNIIGEALWHIGLRHRMSADTASQTLGSLSFRGYCDRRARWVRLRKYIVTTATLVEPLTESVLCGWMGAIGYHLLLGTPLLPFFALHWLFWCLNDYMLYCALIQTHRVSPSRFLRAWLSRECLALPLYLYAMGGTKISWRNQDYRCVSDGTAVAIVKDRSSVPFFIENTL